MADFYGFTPQYKDLQALHTTCAGKGFTAPEVRQAIEKELAG